MKLPTQELLTIDGVALGMTRADVDAMLGIATTNANPAWARYFREPSDLGRLPLLVSFRPAWPQREVRQWEVDSLCGSVLRLGHLVLAQVGESHQAVRARLGSPQSVLSSEPGYGCLVYDGCSVTYEELSGSVVEVSLRDYGRSLLEGRVASSLRDGALAC